MSEIKVNKITPRTACGTTTLGDSGDTFTIPSGVTISNLGTAAKPPPVDVIVSNVEFIPDVPGLGLEAKLAPVPPPPTVIG